MKLFKLIKEDIKNLISQFKCKKHSYIKVRTVYRGMSDILGYKTVWKCIHCGKYKRSKYLDKLE